MESDKNKGASRWDCSAPHSALSGCERSEEEPLALLTLDKERIVFDNPSEGETAQAVLRIEADRRWSVGFIGNGHDCRVSVLSGEAGVHELRIRNLQRPTRGATCTDWDN